MHRNAGEEEDGAVEVEVEEESYEAAHEVPEHPVVPQHVAGHQEGQRQAVHQVRGGQVHHVDQRGVPAPPAAAVGAAGPHQNHRVQHQAEEEGEGVADGQEDVLVGLVDAAGRRREGGGRRGVEAGARHSQEADVWSGAGDPVQAHHEP